MSATDKAKSVETIELYLLSISMDHHISDDPPSDETTKTEWMRDDARLFLSIHNSIDSTVIGLITHCKTVKSLLKYLEFLYSGKENVSRIFDVCQAFYMPEKDDRSLTDYFMAFKKTYAELNELLPFDADISVQQTQRKKMAVMSFLAGLSSDFEIAKSQVLSDTKISSLDEAFSWILRNEHSTNSGSKSPSGPGQWHDNVECRYCHEIGHIKRNCPKLRNKKPPSSTHVADGSGSLTVSTSDYAKFLQHHERNSSSSGPTTALADSGKPTACVASSPTKWVIDSSAIDHMTSNPSLFSTFEPHQTLNPVTLADGSQSIVRGSGTVHPTSSLSLSFVLSLPELSFNLLSDLTTKHIIGKGHESGGLYILDTPPSSLVACVVTPIDAHCRLNKYLVSTNVTFLEHKPFTPNFPAVPENADFDFLIYTVVSSVEPVKSTSLSDMPRPPVVQHYTRRPSAPATEHLVSPSPDSGPDDPIAPSSDPEPSDDLPISLRKETPNAPQLSNKWIEVQESLKKQLITDDRFNWKLPPICKDQIFEGDEENQDSQSAEILKYVGGVDLSFSKTDPSIACATLVVLDFHTLEVVDEASSIVELRVPYVPGFLAFREAPVLLELLEKMKNTALSLYPQVLMVDGNGLLHPRGKFWSYVAVLFIESIQWFAGFGLACHLGVLADLPTIGIGKNLHHVDGLTQSGVRQLLEANGNSCSDIITLIGDSGSTLGAAMRSTEGSLKPVFISVGHRISLASAVEIVKLSCRFRVPEPIRQIKRLPPEAWFKLAE
ncbi:endonuclease V family protein [Perilla frutescens var. hirtella]|nr:endonuclease V family protein [Perilla frutescens var. hirtella]